MNKEKIVAIFSITIVILLIFGPEVFGSFNDKEYVVTVTGKERICTGSKGSKYVVFCDNENGDSLVFQNTDCFLRGKWNSSNMQGKLKYGKTYRIKVVGYRVPLVSVYQNIIEAEEQVGKNAEPKGGTDNE